MIGLVSGTVSASARALGHTISFYTTLGLMLLVGGVLAREATNGPRSYAPTRKQRCGPLALFTVAALLIMVEPTRHVINDANWWPWCGNNPTYDRINSTDPFPSQCAGSSTQYVCTQVCCVSTWQPTDPAVTSFEWLPPSGDFYPAGPLPGPFGTLREDGTVYLPRGEKTAASGPYALYAGVKAEAPLAFFETGDVNPLKRSAPATGCMYGVNTATGYCFLTNQSLSYEEQLLQLPRADPSKPFNLTSNAGICACDGCVPQETVFHLSAVGVISTIVCTYVGFFLLAAAVGWNANLVAKFGKLREQWRMLRGN